LLSTIRPHAEAMKDAFLSDLVTLSSDGSVFALTYPGSSVDAPITLWEIASGKPIATCPEDTKGVAGVTFTANGRELIILRAGATPPRRLAAPFQPTALAGHTDEAWAVAFSRDSRILASGSDDTDDKQTIKLWNPATGELIRGWSGGVGTVSKLAFSPDGKM